MYIEILHEVVAEYLAKEGDKKSVITIELTPFIYKTLQLEINSISTFNTTVPIEGFTFSSLIFYKRSVTIINGKTLDDTFERKMVEQLAKLSNR